MTFAEVKEAILKGLRSRPVCEGVAYHNALLANDWAPLIESCFTYLPYLYRSGILTEALLDEFDSALLESYGIYYKYTGTLTGPPVNPYAFWDSYEIWAIMADITMTYSDTLKYKVNLFDSDVDLSIGNTSYVELNFWNTTGHVLLEAKAVCFMEGQNINGEHLTLEMKDDSYAQGVYKSKTVIDITNADNSYFLVQANANVIINSDLAEEDLEVIKHYLLQRAKINYTPV